MRSYWMGVLLLICLLPVPGRSQQVTSSQPSQLQPPAPQDPQAVSVLNQALVAAGGTAAINAITDYSATGNVTYYWNPEAQGTVTVIGLGQNQSRLDAYLPSGIHSEAIQDGQTTRKTVTGAVWQYPPQHPVPTSDAYPYQPPLFAGALAVPSIGVALVLSNSSYSIAYKGIAQVDEQPAYDILVQLVSLGQTPPASVTQYQSVEYFISTSNLHLVMTQNLVPKHVVHQIRYANYTLIRNVLVPFSIDEQIGGQKTRDIELKQITFNTGLQNSNFVIQ